MVYLSLSRRERARTSSHGGEWVWDEVDEAGVEWRQHMKMTSVYMTLCKGPPIPVPTVLGEVSLVASVVGWGESSAGVWEWRMEQQSYH